MRLIWLVYSKLCDRGSAVRYVWSRTRNAFADNPDDPAGIEDAGWRTRALKKTRKLGYFTKIVIFFETTGGLNGKCCASPSTS